MIVVFGTVALDTTRTPFKTIKNVLGGAATFAGISSSFFIKTGLVGVVGTDFPDDYLKILQSKLDIEGLKKKEGKTFAYDSTFDYDLGKRFSNKTELNIIKDFKPEVPENYRKSEYVYVGNNDPLQNLDFIKQFDKPKLIVCDTIEYWIVNRRDDVIKMIGNVNGTVINDEEARLLCRNPSLVKCAKNIMDWGSDFVIIKKGEHGSILFHDDIIFPIPGYPLEEIVDPTGAGDSFAGGFMGHIARNGKATDGRILKEAAIYGNVMGSFAVEDFSINRFLTLSLKEIEERYEKYRNIVNF